MSNCIRRETLKRNWYTSSTSQEMKTKSYLYRSSNCKMKFNVWLVTYSKISTSTKSKWITPKQLMRSCSNRWKLLLSWLKNCKSRSLWQADRIMSWLIGLRRRWINAELWKSNLPVMLSKSLKATIWFSNCKRRLIGSKAQKESQDHLVFQEFKAGEIVRTLR